MALSVGQMITCEKEQELDVTGSHHAVDNPSLLGPSALHPLHVIIGQTGQLSNFYK